MKKLPVVEATIVQLHRDKLGQPDGPFNLLIVGTRKGTKVGLTHIPKQWLHDAENISVRGLGVLKGKAFPDPADAKKKKGKPPHEVKRWRAFYPDLRHNPYRGLSALCTNWRTINKFGDAEEYLMSGDLVEAELNNGQRVFVRYSPK